MNYGLYVSASGALTAMRRLDVMSNNLANVETDAFKPDVAYEQQRAPERIENNLFFAGADEMLERLGGGVLSAPTQIDFSDGPMRTTDNPLDVAIVGEGFLMVDSGEGAGAGRLRYTRDGRLTVDNSGRLVTATHGFPVLDAREREIKVAPGEPVRVTPSGAIEQGGEIVATLGVARFTDNSVLKRSSESLFSIHEGGHRAREVVTPTVRPGAVEGSGVDPVRAMLAVSRAGGNAQRNIRMISIFDEMMGQTINTFARLG